LYLLCHEETFKYSKQFIFFVSFLCCKSGTGDSAWSGDVIHVLWAPGTEGTRGVHLFLAQEPEDKVSKSSSMPQFKSICKSVFDGFNYDNVSMWSHWVILSRRN
jgi:hypothetical protein